jgi:pimeloyl-ACP methyl ester carboxylesterase
VDAERTTLGADVVELPAAVAEVFADPPPGTARIVHARGYAWHTVEWGQPSDPPLLLLHGVTSSSETFWRVGPCLAADRRRVIAIDLPGHGRTGGWRGRQRWIETAEDVVGFIGASELDRSELTVIGHSWGGMVAAALPAAGFRPQRLILVDPPALRRSALVPLTQDATERRYEHVGDAIGAIRASGVTWSEGDIRAKANALTQIDAAAVRAIYLENGDYDAGVAALADPAAMDVPVWVIRGDPDEGGLIADEHVWVLAGRVGADHIATIAGAGHSPQRTHPEATIVAILQALA